MPHAFAFCIRDQKKIPKGFKMLCEHFHSGIDLTERNACHVARWVTSNLSAVEEKKTLFTGLNSSFVTCLQVLSGTPEDYLVLPSF